MKVTEKKNFTSQLGSYKSRVDSTIENYAKNSKKEILKNYGPNSRIATDAFLEILQRGGKRIRGSLAILAYENLGGKDKKLIDQVALAIELVHAYILIIDDIQDRSLIRRDGPTAHVLLESFHKKNELAGDAAHFGVSIALNSALEGAHMANVVLSNLDTNAKLRLEVIKQLNKTMQTTAHGQTGDIMNEVVAKVNQRDIDSVLEWKTARYTVLNPIQIGMILAGADEKQIKKVENFGLHAGRLFQITDDIIGTFGSEFESGKSPMDDTREGKRTILTVYALENADDGNKNFILSCLGNENLTPASFERFKQILTDCGALEYAKECASVDAVKADKALEEMRDDWDAEGIEFLRQFVDLLKNRKN